jgi:signal peptidase I
MSKQEQPSTVCSETKQGGKFLPALCNVLGTLILVGVILVCLPMVAPRLMGYQIYDIVSGSMEPAIPVGSAVLVETVEPASVQEGDIIAFWSGGSVITHRVVENHTIEGEFVTKGDANEGEDLTNTAYANLVGKVTYHVPMLGDFMSLLSSALGKIYLLALALCGVMFHILAGRMRSRRREQMVQAEIRRHSAEP